MSETTASIDPSHLSAAEAAALGETLRMSGDYSHAIDCFTRAIELKETYFWAYAHRAAARGSLGNYSGAYEDLAKALEHHPTGSYPWLLAQRGEILRQEARAALSDNLVRAYPLMDQAIDAFNEAKQEDNPWLRAHRAAVYTMRYWVGLYRANGPNNPQEDWDHGNADFSRAIELNPSYGWAYAFYGFLVGLKRVDNESEEDKNKRLNQVASLIGAAQMAGLNRPLTILRVLMELAMFQKDYDAAVRLGWQTLQADNDETFARYFVADGLANMNAPEKGPAIERARAALREMLGRVLVMQGGLDCLEGNVEAALGKLKMLGSNRDMEALGMIIRDPAWDAVRNLSPVPAGYLEIFNF